MEDHFDRLARIDLEIDKPGDPDWKFTGFRTPGLTDAQVIDTWHAYRKHGVLLQAGGFIDQPLEWWADMDTCQSLYNSCLILEEPNRPKPKDT